MSSIEPAWGLSWVWGLGLIALTVGIHAVGVAVLVRPSERLAARADMVQQLLRYPTTLTACAMGFVGLVLAAFHALEAVIWAAAYVWLGAIGSMPNAMLYSVDSMTTRGASGPVLTGEWKMLGALEAADGMLLFGISTAVAFAMLSRIDRLLESRVQGNAARD